MYRTELHFDNIQVGVTIHTHPKRFDPLSKPFEAQINTAVDMKAFGEQSFDTNGGTVYCRVGRPVKKPMIK